MELVRGDQQPDLARTLLRPGMLEGAVPSAYLPSLLGDRSFVQYFLDLSQGVSNASFAFGGAFAVVPAAWTLLGFALAALLVARKPVP